jgi:hypothetical protein
MSMNITPDDAREALGAIEQVRAKTRAMLGFNGYFLLIWGCFWLAGGLISEFFGAGRLPWVWIPLYIASLLLSAKLGIDQGVRLRRESSIRIGVFCWLLLFYALLWYIVLQPLATLQGACLLITITFFGYAAIGTWEWSLKTTIFGLVETVLVLVGYYLWPTFFWLWIALACGIPHLGVGFYLLRSRRK